MALSRAAAPARQAARLSAPGERSQSLVGGTCVSPAWRVVEAIATSAAGAALAGLTGSAWSRSAPAAVIGAVHGALAGSRRLYPWRRWQGPVAFVLDHTWALVTSTASLLSHAVAAAREDVAFLPELSERQSRHVYVNGFRLRKGFVVTLGNTVSGLADGNGRRRTLVTDHEDVHIWQSRWFGPLYPVLYLAWMLSGGIVGLIVALAGRQRPIDKVVEAYAYYANPFEWWAYSREGRWPPHGAATGVWRRPAVRSFSARPPADRTSVKHQTLGGRSRFKGNR